MVIGDGESVHTFCCRESETHGHQQGDHDGDQGVSDHLPEHLVGVDQAEFGLRFDCLAIGPDAARPGRVLLPLEDCYQRRRDEEDDAPEEKELGEGDVSAALEGGEEDVPEAPAASLAHAVASRGVANILRLQHCEGPTIDSDILDDTDDQNASI